MPFPPDIFFDLQAMSHSFLLPSQIARCPKTLNSSLIFFLSTYHYLLL